MPTSDLFLRLRQALSNLRTIIDTNGSSIKAAIQALKPLLPQIAGLPGQLIGLMNDLKTEIQNLNVSGVTGLSQLSAFATSAETLLQTSEDLLPNDTAEIDATLQVLAIVEGLPSLVAVKQDILALIDGIVADLNALNS